MIVLILYIQGQYDIDLADYKCSLKRSYVYTYIYIYIKWLIAISSISLSREMFHFGFFPSFILAYSYLGSFPFTLLLVSPLRIIGSIINNNTKNQIIFLSFLYVCVCLLLLLSYLYMYSYIPVYKRDMRKRKMREERLKKWNYHSNYFFLLLLHCLVV